MTARFHMKDGSIQECSDQDAPLTARIWCRYFDDVRVEAAPEVLAAIQKNIDVPLVQYVVNSPAEPEPVVSGSKLPKR